MQLLMHHEGLTVFSISLTDGDLFCGSDRPKNGLGKFSLMLSTASLASDASTAKAGPADNLQAIAEDLRQQSGKTTCYLEAVKR